MSEPVIFQKLISENFEKFYRVMLVVSEFKGKTYLSLRKYFLSFDEDFIPSKEGLTMEYQINSSRALLEGLLEIIPIGECKELLENKLAGKYE